MFLFCLIFCVYMCVRTYVYVCKWETSLTRSHKNFLIEKFLRCCVVVYYPGVRLQFVLFRNKVVGRKSFLTIKSSQYNTILLSVIAVGVAFPCLLLVFLVGCFNKNHSRWIWDITRLLKVSHTHTTTFLF